jgi:lipoprotein-anchoring transpeptidase ErfK/SrfK
MRALTGAAQAAVEVRVDKSAQRMQVFVDGQLKHNFVVSTGLAGGPPLGTFKPQRMERTWHSRLFNMAPMPYSIFFHGHYAIHGTNQVKKLGQRASKGCVRLHPNNAAILFDLVRKHGMGNTRIVIEPSSRARTAELAADLAADLAAESAGEPKAAEPKAE